MYWLEKITCLANKVGLTDVESYCYCASKPPLKNVDSILREHFPSASDSYKKYLTVVDGIQMAAFELYGLGHDSTISALEVKNTLRGLVDTHKYFPVGHDSSAVYSFYVLMVVSKYLISMTKL